MQMYMPDVLSIQAEMYALGSKHLCVGFGRAAHDSPQRRGFFDGQLRKILTMALEHNETLAWR